MSVGEEQQAGSDSQQHSVHAAGPHGRPGLTRAGCSHRGHQPPGCPGRCPQTPWQVSYIHKKKHLGVECRNMVMLMRPGDASWLYPPHETKSSISLHGMKPLKELEEFTSHKTLTQKTKNPHKTQKNTQSRKKLCRIQVDYTENRAATQKRSATTNTAALSRQVYPQNKTQIFKPPSACSKATLFSQHLSICKQSKCT